jgi:hypothetical protein
VRSPTGQSGENILQGGRAGRGDDADGARKARQGTLCRLGKQAFGGKALAQCDEGFIEFAQAGAAQALDRELKIAASLIERHQRLRFDLLAIFQPPGHESGPAAEHGAAHLGSGILE